ncbi:GNAT family N-acetyltransferase [Yinghuangia soli]|uniref:GNAT family N-acetyltransferase n=1 Tax=Yinghuangia soli TaxID=2908204 RepID=A0AA41Q5L7_9ACTN|nr:GNAT family N-acetyltransferase [Yinghuangia soli]MCF2532000.1 GNAT family N-acetyltransferase [Yinghuangia soli]
MLIEPRDFTDPAVVALAAEAVAELDMRYPEDADKGRPLDPSAEFLVAVGDDGTVLGIGALARIDDETAEIKRMYVPPAGRGQGVAKQLLAALEALAVERGARRIKLGTGTRQPEAIALYGKHGYMEIPVYGIYRTNPLCVCFGKDLPGPSAA